LSKESFKNSIFKVVEYFTRYELSDQGKNLIVHYFNDSQESTTFLKSIFAIEKYLQEKMPGFEDAPQKLKTLLKNLFYEADEWDNE